MKVQAAFSSCTKPDVFSKLTMRVIKEKFSHALIIVDGKWVFDCVDTGSRKITLGEFMAEGHVIESSYQLPVDHGQAQYILGFFECAADCNIEYSQSACVGIAAQFLQKLKLMKNGRRKQMCSEFIAFLIQRGMKLDHPAFKNMDFINPSQLEDVCVDLHMRGVMA